MEKYHVLGTMSGTSLDGLDLAVCEFVKDEKWIFQVLRATTVPFPNALKQRLTQAHLLNGHELLVLDRDYARWCGEQMRLWLDVIQLPVALIGYHGQTIFHDPSVGLTFQLGHPAIVAAHAGIDVVGDFRVFDVATGGHGAPLVPAGDRYLFHDYDACVNLGGFANYSTSANDILQAADICPVNMVLNHLAQRTGADYDAGGQLARTGKVIPELFAELENKTFFKLSGPKSLGREWVEKEVLPLLNGYPIRDLMCTYVEHIASRIADALGEQKGKVLFTGGGTHNEYLIQKIISKLKAEVIIPDATVIDFKEAIIFGFLALLRQRGEVNVLSTVTGGKSDHCAGGIFLS